MVPRITAEIYDAFDQDSEYVTLACKKLRKDVKAVGLVLEVVKGKFLLKNGIGDVLYHGGRNFKGVRAFVSGYAVGQTCPLDSLS
jgi:hypothetical protein